MKKIDSLYLYDTQYLCFVSIMHNICLIYVFHFKEIPDHTMS